MCIFDRPAADLKLLKVHNDVEILHNYAGDKKYLAGLVAASKAIREQESKKNENTKTNKT
jgi:hypothetical protein